MDYGVTLMGYLYVYDRAYATEQLTLSHHADILMKYFFFLWWPLLIYLCICKPEIILFITI